MVCYQTFVGNKKKRRTRTKLNLKHRTEQDLARRRLKGSKLNRYLAFLSFLDFLEVMQSTFAQRGARRDKKENFFFFFFFLLCAKSCFFFFFFSSICALIGEPSLFRRSALFMTRASNAQTEGFTHTHTHTHTHTIFSKTTEALLTPTLSPEWADERRSSLTLAFPHKLKLNEHDLEKK